MPLSNYERKRINMPDIFIAKKDQPKANLKTSSSESSPKTAAVKGIDPEIIKEKDKIIGHRTFNPLAAFAARPLNLRFETQEKKEEVILLLRRHPITNLGWILEVLGLFLTPLIVFSFLNPLEFFPARYQLIINIFWYIFAFAFAFEKFLSWFFNVNIITDERIIDIDFPSILYKDISETKIDQVQDVNIRVGGFSRSLFNYGDVRIQTAGTEPEICFEAVPNPEQVSKVLNYLMLEEEQEKLEGRAR